ncbi:UNVERIFIED_CONTAM: hypothetical protein GTU68_017987 [Idotea baltica]|nr:hypothetical protein [Idotea baltica]
MYALLRNSRMAISPVRSISPCHKSKREFLH